MTRHASLTPRTLLVLLVFFCVTSIALSGCHQAKALPCPLHSLFMEKYQAHYRLASSDEVQHFRLATLKKRVLAKAPRYRLHTASKQSRPCSDLMVHKELVLQRQNDPDFVIQETNEYYNARWKLIARYIQDVTPQLATSGHYIATDSLPIPQGAAAGKYYIVTKLMLTRQGKKGSFQLAKAHTSFRILAP